MHKRPVAIAAVLALGLALSPPVRAQSGGAEGAEHPYIVLMRQSPVLAYEGGVAGLAPTKPGKGNKVNPNNAHVRQYDEYLTARHDASLQSAGVDASDKVYDYSFALNGY